jgi:hypothetical protein
VKIFAALVAFVALLLSPTIAESATIPQPAPAGRLNDPDYNLWMVADEGSIWATYNYDLCVQHAHRDAQGFLVPNCGVDPESPDSANPFMIPQTYHPCFLTALKADEAVEHEYEFIQWHGVGPQHGDTLRGRPVVLWNLLMRAADDWSTCQRAAVRRVESDVAQSRPYNDDRFTVLLAMYHGLRDAEKAGWLGALLPTGIISRCNDLRSDQSLVKNNVDINPAGMEWLEHAMEILLIEDQCY